MLEWLEVVSYRNSTSNHNSSNIDLSDCALYLIEILHQTTTRSTVSRNNAGCILSKFYIKPQQRVRHKVGHSCCILSKFYIKPQQQRSLPDFVNVVSYRNSTSNHNRIALRRMLSVLYLIEILHQTTTQGIINH